MFAETGPIYLQIADQIRDDIVGGALRPGEQVRSTNQYAAFHRINPATAGKAFQVLVDEGVLEKRRGIGMFVAGDAHEQLRRRRRSAFVERFVVPLAAEATRLGIPADEVVAAVTEHVHPTGAPR